MGLWTLIAEYKGGTYIEQAVATSLDEAVQAICSVTESKFLLSLLDEEELKDPVKITGIENVWCITGLFENTLVLANIVLTSESKGA